MLLVCRYAVILAFDVKVEREAQEMADTQGIRVFTADIIYHLFDAFTKYRDDYKAAKQNEFRKTAVFPCKLRVLPQYIFNSRDPIVLGVIVEEGFLKQGTPICVPSKEVRSCSKRAPRFVLQCSRVCMLGHSKIFIMFAQCYCKHHNVLLQDGPCLIQSTSYMCSCKMDHVMYIIPWNMRRLLAITGWYFIIICTVK